MSAESSGCHLPSFIRARASFSRQVPPSPLTPREPRHVPIPTRRLLDAVTLEPGVQVPAAFLNTAAGCITVLSGRLPDSRCLAGLCVYTQDNGRPARSRKLFRTAGRRWTTHRRSNGAKSGRVRARERASSRSPKGLDHVFFTNSGSESVRSALKNRARISIPAPGVKRHATP